MENDLFKSLNSLLPKYETVLPFQKTTVSFTPFKVKDAKHISVILQEENKKLALTSLVNVLKSNTEGVDILNLCLADAEFLFLQIRSKSVDELLNLVYNGEKVQLYILDILSRNSVLEEVIDINVDTKIILETPKIKDLIKLQNFDKENLIKSCIKKIVKGGEIFYTNKFIPEQLHELVDNLPMYILPKIETFLQKQPELYGTIQTKEGPKEVSGFLNFFTYR